MTTVTADMLRRGRDLADMDAALKAEKEGLIFMETSPREAPVVLYSMADGEPIPMLRPIAEMAIKKRYKNGQYLFTDKQEEAPVYKLGDVKCFLHPESPERLSGVLDEVGIASAVCHSEHLASKYARRVHAENRHGKRWDALKEHLDDIKEQSALARQEQQLEATLALAGRAATAPQTVTVKATPLEEMPDSGLSVSTVEVRYDCAACGWVNEKNTAQGLELHTSRWCQRKEADDATIAE